MNAEEIIKLIILISTNYCLFIKICGLRKDIFIKLILAIFYIVIISLINLFFAIDEPYKSIIIVLLLSFLIFKLVKDCFSNTLISIAMAYSISHILFFFTLFISLVFFKKIFGIVQPNIKVLLLTGVIEMGVVLIILRIRTRFEMFNKRQIGGIGLTLWGIIIVIYSILREDILTDKVTALLFTGIVICGIGLFYWLRREKVIAVNEQDLNSHLLELQKEVDLLTQTHDTLSAKVHQENKRLPAIEEAVRLIVTQTTDLKIKNKAKQMLDRISEIREEWSGKSFDTTMNVDLCGMPVVDAVLVYMGRKAKEQNINLSVVVKDKPNESIKQKILEVLAAELIENAIVAVKNSDTKEKSIIVEMGMNDKIFEFSVEDNGISFATSTFHLLTEQRFTTHESDGGSGFGYYNILRILEECNASLSVINNPMTNYKIIVIKFDGQKNYSIEPLN